MTQTKVEAPFVEGGGGNNFRNLVINGDMQIWQRATATTTVTSGEYQTVDRHKLYESTDGVYTAEQDVLSVDYHSTYHVMGTKWGNAADNPANSALRTGSNWSATYDIDLIPMVEIFVNTPLDNGLKS